MPDPIERFMREQLDIYVKSVLHPPAKRKVSPQDIQRAAQYAMVIVRSYEAAGRRALSVAGNFMPTGGGGLGAAISAATSFSGVARGAVSHEINRIQPKPGPFRRGSRGPHVMLLQVMLYRTGTKLALDGAFGAITDAAVRYFQMTHKLKVDGVVGPHTWHDLIGAQVH